MAEVQTNSLKRPHPNDDTENGDSAQKRMRAPNGSPAPQKARPDASRLIADARARAEAVKARLQGAKSLNGLPSGAPPSSSTPPSAPTGAPMSRVEEMRARVAALTAKSTAQSQQRTASPASSYQPPVHDDGLSRARGGLSAALHPSLLESSSAVPSKGTKSTANNRNQSTGIRTSKSIAKPKKQLDLSGPSLEEIRQNPYVDASIATTMRSRNPKQLKFLEKGKYIAQAAALRRQTQLEEMKKRIAMQSRKVGISEDPSEKNFLVEAPPEIEWWDESLVLTASEGYVSAYKLDGPDSAITLLEVHPISIAKPTNAVEVKPMYLTSKEQAKLRRQRRMADLKEHQMKVRLGMLPPDPPKVKRGNMMRVLGEEAVKDPTAVEARVNKEIAERAQKHLDTNEERKLSKETKNEKLDAKKATDLSRGVTLTVYKIDSLANGRHFFKVQKNMEQIGGLGLILSSPKFSLVLCEAGQRGTHLYKKLILNRIDVSSKSPALDRYIPSPEFPTFRSTQTCRTQINPLSANQWTENAPSLQSSIAASDTNATSKKNNSNKPTPSWLQPELDPQTGELKDLSANKAQLIFEGEEKGTNFRKITTRAVETDKEAMELLDRSKMGQFWTLARSLA